MCFTENYCNSQEQNFIKLHGRISSILLPLEIKGYETLSQPYSYEIECVCKGGSDSIISLHGEMLSCEIGEKIELYPTRFIHGIITKIVYHHDKEQPQTCTLTVQPEMSKLHSGKNTRIWSKVTASDIVMTIFEQHYYIRPDIRITKSIPIIEYKIQYQESDLDFIDRILSEAGICYFFSHSKNSHTLVLADDPVSHPDAAIDVFQHLPSENVLSPGYIRGWSATSSLKSPEVILSGYNINNASEVSVKLYSSLTQVKSNNTNYKDITPEGNREHLQHRAKVFMAFCDNEVQKWNGLTNSWWLACGDRFTLLDGEKNKEKFRVISLHITAKNNHNGCEGNFSSEFYAADNKTTLTFGSKKRHPQIAGVLLARVIGPESEDIFTDDYGRVKIRFLWGAESTSGTEKDSCWVRVSQTWSGDNFGSQFIPRIGSEVLVSFIQGDPDYPIIIGTVYNGMNKPIFSLPDNNSKSGFITRSVKNGNKGEGHQLIFDDKKDAEKTILSSAGDFCLTVKKELISNVNKSLSLTIAEGRRSEIKKGNDVLKLSQGDLKKDITGNININVSQGDYYLKVSGGSVGIKTDKNLSLESTKSLQLKVGSSQIILSPTGIKIKGATITLEGQSTTEIKGITLKLEGQAVTEMKGTILNLKSSAMAQIKGGLVNIG